MCIERKWDLGTLAYLEKARDNEYLNKEPPPKKSHPSCMYRLYLKLFKEAILLGKRHREKVLREDAEAEEDDRK